MNMFLKRVSVSFFIIFLITVAESEAYVDPGTGGMIVGSVSTVIAIVLGALGSMLVFFRKAVVKLYSRKGMFIAACFSLCVLLSLGFYILIRH